MKPSLQEKIALFIFHNEENFDLIAVIILFSLVVLMVWFG